eukprot:703689-Alexandrium_andersonii.AAC.1
MHACARACTDALMRGSGCVWAHACVRALCVHVCVECWGTVGFSGCKRVHGITRIRAATSECLRGVWDEDGGRAAMFWQTY